MNYCTISNVKRTYDVFFNVQQYLFVPHPRLFWAGPLQASDKVDPAAAISRLRQRQRMPQQSSSQRPGQSQPGPFGGSHCVAPNGAIRGPNHKHARPAWRLLVTHRRVPSHGRRALPGAGLLTPRHLVVRKTEERGGGEAGGGLTAEEEGCAAAADERVTEEGGELEEDSSLISILSEDKVTYLIGIVFQNRDIK